MENKFFERYADLCKQDDETPNSIARIVGASSGSVTAWKNGTAPRNATLSKIADHFKVSTDYLLGKSDDLSIIHLLDSQQEELRRVFSKSLDLRGLTPAEAIAFSKAGYNFFLRLDKNMLHRVRLNNLLAVAEYLGVEDEINLIIGRMPVEGLSVEGRSISHSDIKFALFRGREGITDAMYEEVLNFAEYVARREEEKKKE